MGALELVLTAILLALAGAIALPLALFSEATENEGAAIRTLRAILKAQVEFRAANIHDTDADGTGEFAFLPELAGEQLRDGRSGVDMFLALGESALWGAKTLDGYHFIVFLPADGGVGVRYPADTVDPDDGETTWCAFAWPVSHGTTGKRSFFINQEGRVLATETRFSRGGPWTGPFRDTHGTGTRTASTITGPLQTGAPDVADVAWKPVR